MAPATIPHLNTPHHALPSPEVAPETTVASVTGGEAFRQAIGPGNQLGDTASGMFPCKYSLHKEQKTTSPGCRDIHIGCFLPKGGLLLLPNPTKIFPGCGTSHAEGGCQLRGATGEIKNKN